MRFKNFIESSRLSLLPFLLLFAPIWVHALGLGNIEGRSRINEPLEAVIPILSATQDDLASLNVKVATAESFRKNGIPWSPGLSKIRFNINLKGDRKYIRVYGKEVYREPFFSILLEVNWSNGNLLREYTLLLDPPAIASRRRHPRKIIAPVVAAGKRSAPEEEGAFSETLHLQEANDSGRQILSEESLSESTPSEYDDSVLSGEISLGLSGAAEEETYGRSTEAAVENEQSDAAEASVFSGDYGPVRPGETLWGISQRHRPKEVSIQRFMIALQRINREAFIHKNINGLKRGKVLRLPNSDEMLTIRQQEAYAIVKSQNDSWGIVVPQERAFGGGVRAVSESTQTADLGTGDSSARLRLVSPSETKEVALPDVIDSGVARGGDGRASRELKIAQESLASIKLENTELKSKVAELQSVLEDYKTLINVSDSELAALQEQGRKEQIQPTDKQDASFGSGTNSGADRLSASEDSAVGAEAKNAPPQLDKVKDSDLKEKEHNDLETKEDGLKDSKSAAATEPIPSLDGDNADSVENEAVVPPLVSNGDSNLAAISVTTDLKGNAVTEPGEKDAASSEEARQPPPKQEASPSIFSRAFSAAGGIYTAVKSKIFPSEDVTPPSLEVGSVPRSQSDGANGSASTPERDFSDEQRSEEETAPSVITAGGVDEAPRSSAEPESISVSLDLGSSSEAPVVESFQDAVASIDGEGDSGIPLIGTEENKDGELEQETTARLASSDDLSKDVKPIIEPPLDKQGFLSSLQGLLLPILLFIALLGGGVYFYQRHKKRAKEGEESNLRDALQEYMETSQGDLLQEEDTLGVAAKSEKSLPEKLKDEDVKKREKKEPTDISGTTTPVLKRAPVSAASSDDVDDSAGDADLLPEINSYLAYEQFSEAEEIAKTAIAASPGKTGLLMKLLEVYYTANNIRHYQEIAKQVQDKTGGTGSRWEAVLAMWSELSPGKELFSPGWDAGKLDDITAKAGEVHVEQIDIGDAGKEAADLDFDLDPYSETSEKIDFNFGDLTELIDVAESSDAPPPVGEETGGNEEKGEEKEEISSIDDLPSLEMPDLSSETSEKDRGSEDELALDGLSFDALEEESAPADAGEEQSILSLDDNSDDTVAEAASSQIEASEEFSLDNATPSGIEEDIVEPSIDSEKDGDMTSILGIEEDAADFDSTMEIQSEILEEVKSKEQPDEDAMFTAGEPEEKADAKSSVGTEEKDEDSTLMLDLEEEEDLDTTLALHQTTGSDDEEISGKLDLAKAYVELGDTDSAKGVLQEVIQGGNSTQRSQAQELLSQL